jgi:protein-S-isoprenylcysteine O-methyltransferase Ste14
LEPASRLFRHRGALALLLGPALLTVAAGAGGATHPAAGAAGLVLITLGLAARWHVAGTTPRDTCGRSTRWHLAAELNTTGLYSMTRHPLYLANALVLLGFAVRSGALWLPVVVSGAAIAWYWRIVREEEAFLERRFGESWREYAARVPVMPPRIRGYAPARLRFSWRAALGGEFYGLCGVIAALALLELAAGGTTPRFALVALLAACGAAFLALRILKRRTTLLEVVRR